MTHAEHHRDNEAHLMIHIVMLAPEIPANTGNIGRTCVVTGARLHLIKPLGFKLDDTMIRRAGLDYWHALNVAVYEDLDHFMEENPRAMSSQQPNSAPTLFLFTKKVTRLYTEVEYPQDCYLMFGRESSGIPEELLMRYSASCVRIPMRTDHDAVAHDAFTHTRNYARKNRQQSNASEITSLNVSNAVAIAAYEVLRQQGFPGMHEPNRHLDECL